MLYFQQGKQPREGSKDARLYYYHGCRKEVSFTFEDAMYVAAAVYKHDYSQNASTIRGDLWAALKFYFGWYYSDKLMKERGIDSKMFLSDQYYISDKELDAIVHYIFEVAFTRLLCK